ncbi:MAG: pilus assembly protein PilZ [Candidatus Dactylopiibacterium carminicum]|uniref:Pilus assembly protein PilZ n=1 Tax=Candidatus Dactylopiibacterium carminicum TaxID=857335 RepID=A0A272ENY8_9RHOO|nr:PilZ domain-containing protein [Candidatus Dactylopiibacterium carminicum]KAF7598159.1 pilus assembly protein PilZ [Candidatus Dactylopiibacterium carminicum]PAS91834.1 MAG: pilus assembly protein PilZ [Candidatus Dactylopiibacterium carminicum]PAS94528.1 MAG: pilus assembly protein PilZ [Candidatus Dactylopiibacterium carminicum]PAS96809.1 MAG: pilus assembly protein PilZ [Candidatus Dactylopiibacterium carminicum]
MEPKQPSVRAGVLSLNINSKSALYAAYMPFLKGGGLFIPTNRNYAPGDEVFMLLQLMDDPTRLAVKGKVAWITPANAQNNRTQGVGVQFAPDEGGSVVKVKIEQVLGGALGSSRPTHTL